MNLRGWIEDGTGKGERTFISEYNGNKDTEESVERVIWVV